MKHSCLILPILILLAVSVWNSAGRVCAQEESAESESREIAKLGCLLPMSGKYGLIGEKALRGVLTAVKAGSRSVEYEVVVRDIGDDAARFNAAFDDLSRVKDLSFIVGPIPAGLIDTVSPRVNAAKIPTVVFPLSEDEASGGPYVIKYYYPLDDQAQVLSQYAVRELGARTFAVLYPASQLGEKLKEKFTGSVTEAGGKVVYEASYDPRSRDISGEMAWIASVKPEAVFIPDGAASSAELISKLKRFAKLRDVLFLGPSTWNSPVFMKLVGQEIDGFVTRAVFTDNLFFGDEDWRGFKSLYSSEFEGTPDALEYQVYRAVRLMISLEAGGSGDGESLMKSLYSLENNPNFEVKKEKNGSIRISPRFRVLSVNRGEVIDIMKVRGN